MRVILLWKRNYRYGLNDYHFLFFDDELIFASFYKFQQHCTVAFLFCETIADIYQAFCRCVGQYITVEGQVHFNPEVAMTVVNTSFLKIFDSSKMKDIII